MLRRLLPLLALALLAPPVSGAAAAGKPSLEPPAGAFSARQHKEAREALDKAEALRAGRGIEDGFELTPALRDLAVHIRALSGSERRRAARLLARPTQGEGNLGEDEYTTNAVKAHCSPHFCVHWVETTSDAISTADGNGNQVPDYVETVERELEHTYAVEHGELGWRTPVPDRTGTTDTTTVNRTDVYLKQLGDQRIFGYAAPDPFQQTNAQHAFLVLDNDYSPAEYSRYSEQLPPLQVTVAHEYNHVIQFSYDVLQDAWMFESTAVWMEDRVYDDVNDYVSYLTAWSQLGPVPLTQFSSSDPSDPGNQKVYGSAVWNRWLDERYGAETIRHAWEASLVTRPASFAPGAYDRAIRMRGGEGFFDAFTRFVAETAEWRFANFHEGEEWPDMQRLPDEKGLPFAMRADGPSVSGRLDHTGWGYIDVQQEDGPMKLVVTLPKGSASKPGPAGGAALVGLRSPELGGGVEVYLKRMPEGGRGVVELDDAGGFIRLTAVLVNADTRQRGYSSITSDWVWEKDAQRVMAHMSSDFDPPSVRRRSPSAGRRNVSRRSRVKVRFSEPMAGVDKKSFQLIGPGNKPVRARVKYRARRREAVLDPRGRLRRGRRYRVQVGVDVVDDGANPLPNLERRWVFTTAR